MTEVFASPLRSSVSAVLSLLPFQSLSESTFNCFIEHYVEPLRVETVVSTPQSSPSSRDIGKARKGSKITPGKVELVSPGTEHDPSSTTGDKEVEQAMEWSGAALQSAKKNPDMAYKLFARAAQVFAKKFRTREAAQNYYSVVQLQLAILKSKYPDLVSNPQGVPFSMAELATEGESLTEEAKQASAGLLVLFKSNLYLARLLLPFDLPLACRFFSNCLDCILPTFQTTALNRAVLLDQAPLPHFRCSIDYLSYSCRALTSSLAPTIQFIDLQRSQAAAANPNAPPFVPFALELFNYASEAAFLISSQEANPLSIVLLSFADSLAFSSKEPYTGHLDRNIQHQATIFRSLGHAHRQADCLLDYALHQWPSAEAVEMSCNAMHRAFLIDDQTRLKRYSEVLTPKLIGLDDSCPLRFLVRLSAILLRSDAGELGQLLVEPEFVRLLSQDAQLSATLSLLKSRL